MAKAICYCEVYRIRKLHAVGNISKLKQQIISNIWNDRDCTNYPFTEKIKVFCAW